MSPPCGASLNPKEAKQAPPQATLRTLTTFLPTARGGGRAILRCCGPTFNKWSGQVTQCQGWGSVHYVVNKHVAPFFFFWRPQAQC